MIMGYTVSKDHAEKIEKYFSFNKQAAFSSAGKGGLFITWHII